LFRNIQTFGGIAGPLFTDTQIIQNWKAVGIQQLLYKTQT
jgi:hypothetical protein